MNSIHKVYRGSVKFRALSARLFFIVAFFSGLSDSVLAKTIRVTCGDGAEYIINTDTNTLSFDKREEQIVWKFDGEWLRIQRPNDLDDIAFGLSSGILILRQQSEPGFCAFEEHAVVASLPLARGAQLRRVFLKLSDADRQILQSRLGEIGLYDGIVDGLWGRRTEAAITSFYDENRQLFATNHSIETEAGAAEVFHVISLVAYEGAECDGCDENVMSLPIHSPLKPKDQQNFNDANHVTGAGNGVLIGFIIMVACFVLFFAYRSSSQCPKCKANWSWSIVSKVDKPRGTYKVKKRNGQLIETKNGKPKFGPMRYTYYVYQHGTRKTQYQCSKCGHTATKETQFKKVIDSYSD